MEVDEKVISESRPGESNYGDRRADERDFEGVTRGRMPI
jgi:hypothetical protein